MHDQPARGPRPAARGLFLPRWAGTATGAFLLSATLAAPTLACDWDAAFPEHRISAFTWEAVEEAVDIPAAELLAVAGEIIFAPAAAGGSVDDRLCVEVATSLTCSMGISVCTFVVIGPEPARDVELVTSAHEMSALPSADSPYPVITTRISTASGTMRTRYEWHGGTYHER